MCKAVFLLALVVVVLITESSCKTILIIRPARRPPPRRIIIIRRIREAPANEPLWLNQGDIPRAPATSDHPALPKYIDDVRLDPNRRYARSLDSSNENNGGGSDSDSESHKHSGLTHTGYFHRQTRDIRLPFDPLPRPYRPFDPLPRPHGPIDPYNPYPLPGPRPPYPIYV